MHDFPGLRPACCLLLTFWFVSFGVVEESVLLDCCLVDFCLVINKAATCMLLPWIQYCGW